jgi:hypothetical protein
MFLFSPPRHLLGTLLKVAFQPDDLQDMGGEGPTRKNLLDFDVLGLKTG